MKLDVNELVYVFSVEIIVELQFDVNEEMKVNGYVVTKTVSFTVDGIELVNGSIVEIVENLYDDMQVELQ